MRINLFEFPADRERLRNPLQLRRSISYWTIVALVLGVSLVVGWDLFLGPNRALIFFPPRAPSYVMSVACYVVWVAAFAGAFSFVASAAVLDRDGVSFRPLLRPGKTISLGELAGIDFVVAPGLYQNSSVIVRVKDSRKTYQLRSFWIKDDDLQELCRAAGLNVVDKDGKHL